MSGYRDQKKCDNCGQWLDPLEKCGCHSTTPPPPPAPAGEREAFERIALTRRYDIEKDTTGIYFSARTAHDWNIWRLAWQARASFPAPAPGLTAEDREQIRQARVRDPQVHREALSIHERDRRNLLAIIDRLTGSADGEGGRCR